MPVGSLDLGYFWQTGCKSGHPTIPCSGSSLLEQITELRRTLYFCLLAYFRGYNSGTVKWKRGIGQGLGSGEGTQLPFPLWVCRTPSTPLFTRTRKLSETVVSVFFNGDFIQFTSVAQSCPTLCYPIDCSTPVLPVHHQLPEFSQIRIHSVGDATQPSQLLSSPSPAFNLGIIDEITDR